MATIRFFGGVGVIGSSKILIEQEGWRILLDFGLDFSPGLGLFRGAVRPRPGHELSDRLKTQMAPHIPHLYRPELLRSINNLPGGSDGHTAVFITHAHLDHIGLAGAIDPAIPIWASPETVQLMHALEISGEDSGGEWPVLRPMAAEQPIAFGPFQVTRYAVDHDIIGASGYAVETEDGVVAFSGDLRLHGRHPEQTWKFAHKVRGARALIMEGTTLSFGFQDATRTEEDVDQAFAKILAQTPGLVLATVYPRNIERVAAFIQVAREMGRTFLWPERMTQFFQAMGLAAESWDADHLDPIQKHPERYIIQLTAQDWPMMLDLPMGPSATFIHANGEPLGTFDPHWTLLQDWLAVVHTSFWAIGTGGHASPDDIRALLDVIQPDILFPLHSKDPDRMLPPVGTVRWLPEKDRLYDLSRGKG
ncbi:MAG: MBL fold metallo-hydrolase [Sulfobacillus thermotolerans]|uniref:Metallo-beta-lactamase domain-containing protein n=2 Tax=Bacteria TaxID=2 RepID=A0ABM6RTN0_9FIRM|nr:hypothetical protein BXT84_13280 [Sulfobacillus thermotolerans]MCY0906833.1 MBL fold metallo-hydrolase [Sulfobacillus thermotolerans]